MLNQADAACPATPRPARTIAVRLEDVSRHYGRGEGKVAALEHVSLEVATGDFIAIMGPSGSGKSTLLNLIGALDQPSSGSIIVGGNDIARLSPREAARYRRREVGFIFQSFNLLPRLTVLENVAVPLMFEGVAPAERKARAREILAELGLEERLQHQPGTLSGGDKQRVAPAERKARAREILAELGLEGRLQHQPGTLSGGEKQRVAIARALINKPRLLLADEPTGNLDSRNAGAVVELLRELNHARGQTIILITHNPEVAEAAGRVIRMRDGRISDGDEWKGA